MSRAEFRIGDVFDRLAEIPDGTIDLVLTSPPFLALRSYLPADHPDKAKEIGSEANPAEFIDTLLRLSAEWRRVLAPHGSICVELGDTYAGSGQGPDERSYSAGAIIGGRRQPGAGWPLDKSMCGIPHLYHLSLAYGRNLLTGQPSPAGQWRVRNVVAWCRPNPPVGALGDKVRPATSYMTMACISRTRYFDLDAVREQHKHGSATATGSYSHGDASGARRKGGDDVHGDTVRTINLNPAGAPPLDWWEIPTEPYAGSHYATWPKALLTRPILMMCPEKVCRVCGEPSRRIVGEAEYVNGRTGAPSTALHLRNGKHIAGQGNSVVSDGQGDRNAIRQAPTLGWTDCGCSTDGSHWRRGVVLDPFGGSGSTAAVATGLGRDCVLIDIDHRNAHLAQERVGMFLEVTA